MKNKKNIVFVEWLDDRGYGIFQHVQADKSLGELILARACIEKGRLLIYEEIITSKHMPKILSRYQHEVKTNKDLIMDIRETISGLSIEELQSLLPSYYQLAIEGRIAELKQQQQFIKPKENEVVKVKRGRKARVKKSN